MADNPYVNKVVVNNQAIIDLTGDTVDAAHLAQGYTAHDMSGATIVGTMSGGGDPNPTTDPVNEGVNFFDFDGTCRYSYTVAEALALTALPQNPTHDGLISQGWNWTLAEIQAELTACPYLEIDVGQYYATTDGKTRLYVHYNKDLGSVKLKLYNTTTSNVIDWGDGTTTTCYDSGRNIVVYGHEWDTSGDYVITISGTVEFGGDANANYAGIFVKKTTDSTMQNNTPSSILEKIEFGNKCNIRDFAFYGVLNLKSVTFPKSSDCKIITSGQIFSAAYSLKFFMGPVGYTSIHNLLNYCYSMHHISFVHDAYPTESSFGSATSGYCLQNMYFPLHRTLYTYSYYNNYAITRIIVPAGVTAGGIQTSAFYRSLYGLNKLVFMSQTPPSVAASSVFTDLPTSCTIYVPTGTLQAYQEATNYPDPAVYTYVEY